MRLVTTMDLDERDSVQVSVALLLELEVEEGVRVALLSDRGWSESQDWSDVTLDHLKRTAVVAVGPDEPFDDYTQEQLASDHWGALARVATRKGIPVDARTIANLPHSVEATARLLTLLSRRHYSE